MVMNYYPRIRELREETGLSQSRLADMLDMPQSQYFRYEQGYRDIPTDILKKLAQIFNVSVDYILDLTDERTMYSQSEADKENDPAEN